MFIFTPRTDDDSGPKILRLVAVACMLFPEIFAPPDIKNDEVESPAKINEAWEDLEIKVKTLEPLSVEVVLIEAVLKISLPLIPSRV